jgi:hypothetical protein
MSEKSKRVLGLRVGDSVEVRSVAEILATLEPDGTFEAVPFMPEMLEYCGKRFRVFKRADKTCDNIKAWSLRRLRDSVHLESVRCDGCGHGGCEAGCLIFWKEAWLKRVETNLIEVGRLTEPNVAVGPNADIIFRASRARESAGEEIYSCQATELRKFTSELAWWDLRQYIRDLRSGNLSSGLAGISRTERALEMALGCLQLLRAPIIEVFNRVQKRRRSVQYPSIEGWAEKTPISVLNLQPGELVQVRSKNEILATLDRKNRNRGLLFDSEMLRYCGGIYRVLRRVYRIIDEKTGKMLEMKYPCIILEGVACQSDYHRFCPRAIYHYWRENWLLRANIEAGTRPSEDMAETCEKC